MSDQRYDREESPTARLDRHWIELLQELRVAQTGTQILFAFLLTIAFTVPFAEAGSFTRTTFALTLVAAAMATGLLIAPVSVHRLVYRRQLRPELVDVASKMAGAGLFLLLLTVSGGLLLALDATLSRGVAIGVVAAIAGWFGAFWYGVPILLRRRARSSEQVEPEDAPTA